MCTSIILRPLFAAGTLAAVLTGCASTNPTIGPATQYPQSNPASQRVLPTLPAQGPILVQPLPVAPGAGRTTLARTGPHLVQYFSIPGTTPFYITLGPRQAFWFTTGDTPGSIGRIKPSKPYTLFPLPPSGWNVSLRIVTGPDDGRCVSRARRDC